MKFFRKYIFLWIYGLLIYFTLHLIHDVEVHSKFWQRIWTLNFLEMGCCVLTGYCDVYFFERLLKYFDRKWPLQFATFVPEK